MAENRLQGTEDVELDNREPKPLTDDAKSDLVVRAGSQPEANAAGLKNEGHKDAHSEGACPEEEEGDNQQQPEVSIHAEATLRRACVQVHPLSEGYSAGKESSSGSQPDCETAEEAKETCDFGQTGTEVTPCTDVAEHKGSEELTECTARCLPNPCSSNTEHMTLEFIAPLSSKWTCKGSNVKIVVGIYKEPGVYEECADMHLAANKDIERIIAKGRISLSNLQHGKPLYYRYGILDFYDDNRPLQLEDFPETSSKNKKNLFLRVLVIPERTIEANGVWTQYDDTCHFQNEGWRLFRGTPSVSKDSISYVVKEFRQECKQNFTDLERKIHCYILCSKARKRFDVKQNKTTEVGCKKEETANIICKFAEEIIKMPKAPDCTASIVQELLFSLYILFCYKLPIHRGFWTEIKNVLPYTYPLEGKLPNLTEDRKSDYIRALMYTCKSRSSSESRSSGWMWLIPLLYAVAYQGPTSEATQKLLHEEIKQLSFHLLGTEGKQEKVIKMIKAHQTFIEKCAPLAKQIIEMLTLNSLAEVLTLPIRLPLLPLLERVCSQDFTEGKIKENISRSVLTELVGRTESWLRDKFLLQKEKSVLEAKELEDILRGVELVFSLVKNCFQNSWSNEVIPALQILNVFSSTEDLLKNEKAFKNLRGTDRCKNFEKCAKEWVEKAFPKPQKKSHFLKGIDKWQQLFSVRLFCDEWTTQWQELIHLSYSEWIKKIEHEDLFSYYKAFLDTEKYQDRDLASSLLEHILQNIEKMPKTKVTGLQHIIRNFSRMKTSVVEKILSAVIESMWTEDLRLITEPTRFEEETGNVIVWLLESSLGQDIISTIHQPKRPICINEKAQELLSKVLKLLSFVGDSLFLGDIPCSVLRGLLKHKQGFITMLCTIDKSPKKSECFTHQNITHVLDIREQELKQLEEQKKQKCAFIKMCNSISAVIKVDLDGMTQSTDEKQSIRNQMSVKTFSIEEEIKRADTEPPALAKYDGMVRKVYTLKESQCFPKLWKLKAEQAKGKFPGEAILSLDEAQENIYNPAMEDFEKTYRSLKDCSINFGSIKRQFKTVIKEKVLLKKEFEIMENSMGEAGSKRSWVETAMDKIHNYETLSTVVQTAQMINELRRELGLDGDFQILDDLTRYNEEDFKNKRLDYITDDVMKVKKTLSDLSPNVLDFLKELLECSKKSFVSWVKAIIKDRTELPTFVDLASISAGEDNMDFDKVQFFHKAISVSGPIIFDLNSTSGFEDFCAALQPIKEAIVDDNVLPEKLRVSCLNKEWLQMVHDCHGSVERSSLSQARAINSKGIFIISAPQKLKPSLDDCISLELPEDDAKSAPQQDATAKKAYSLAQLTELQNKLMLIATKVEQGQEEAKRFLEILEKIRMVGKLYLELLEVGNILFIDWKAQVDCGHKHNINIYVEFGISGVLVQSNRPFLEELSGICRAMERCLGEWKKYLETQRNNYYHLNMFTARQLFYLCSKLATANKTEVDLQVLNLLSVFKHDITVEDIRDALNKALETPSESISMAGEDEQSVTWLSYTVKFPQLIQSLVDAGYDESVVKAGLQSYSPNVAITEQMLMEYALEHGENEEEIEELSKLYEEQREDFLQKSKKFKKRSTEAEQYAFSSLTKDKLAVSFESLPSIQDKVNLLWDAYCTRLTGLVSDRYISLDVFGEMLKCLATAEASCIERNLPVGFEAGRPGLVMCKEEEMLRYMLSVYRCTEKAPLPTSEEVLVCTSETREEDVELIVRRALSPGSKHKKIYCLLGADKLVYKVSKKLEFQFFHLAQSSSVPDYRFLIFCDAKAHNSYIITAFDNYKVSLSCNSEADIQQYLRTHLTVPMAPVTRAFEEPYRQNMKFVFSEEAGMGKSLFVANTIKKAKDLPENTGLTHKTIRMMESEINFGFLLKELCSLEDKPTDVVPRIFHIDVSPVVSKGLYRLLIELCILRHTQSPDGLVWKCRASHLYLIEYMVRGKGISSTRKQEMTSNMEREFLALLPAVKCVSPVEVLEVLGKSSSGTDVAVERQLLDRGTFKGEAFQRSYQYLRRYQNHQNLDRFCYSPQTVEGTEEECLRLLLQCCGRKNPSWTELSNFAQFLSLQLMKCETSVFCSEAAGREFGGFKSFVIKFMIAMSKDFAMPSLVMSDESFPRGEGKKEEDSVLTGYQLRRKWEQESHPYIVFHADNHSMEFLGFHINKNYDAVDAYSGSVLEKKVIGYRLYHILSVQKVPFNKKFEDLPRQEQLETLCSIFGVKSSQDPDESYKLTLDNTMKMLAIHLRFQCGIPVIIMGETGCGKTKLVQFMCSLQRAGRDIQNMMLVRVHGGTSSHVIHQKVREAIELAQRNGEEYDVDTVLFFDEANTTEAVFAIKEVLCDHSINGEQIPTTRLKVVAACNPYKRHTEETIEKLEKAGLGYRVRSEDTLEKLGYVPLRQLVYRVQPLPPSMLPLVWDFGELNEQTQSLYIQEIVRSIVKDKLPGEKMEIFTSVILTSQKFLRVNKDECRITSLRDVERCMKVLLWFYNLKDLLFPLIDQKSAAQHSDSSSSATRPDEYEKGQMPPLNAAQRSLVLSMGVCYYMSLERGRQDYLEAIAKCFSLPAGLLQQEIVLCQEVFLDNLTIPELTARNDALRENSFMMVICMDLRVPLFLVGKPGSSKSLSKTIAVAAMQGRLSKIEFFKSYKQIQVISFQCSPHSRPEGIISTFKQCSQFQKGQKLDEFASVVILDEVGLAEDSPEMPLKTLHPLLEDGCVDDETPEPYKKVGFVGISNWALDPAKMNRGLFVLRTEPKEDELVKMAKEICAGCNISRIEHTFPFLANFYCEVLKTQSAEFFGLRDFYSLIKMILSYTQDQDRYSAEELIGKAILRNFGGSKDIDPLKLFKTCKPPITLPSDLETRLETTHTVDLLRENLDRSQTEFVSRYLLLITINHAAFQILQMTKLMDIESCDVIFGSGFPQDQEYSQVCRSVNRVKICMETGRPVILLNIQNLYESLYDALNQCFVKLGENKYVDLGLGTHRVKCRVKKEFKLVVIEEKNVVYTQFPTPLLNRLEKHCLEMNTILSSRQVEVRRKLQQWARLFVTVRDAGCCSIRWSNGNPKEQDVFIGFSEDVSATVLLQCSQSSLQGNFVFNKEQVLEACKSKFIDCATPDSILRLKYSSLQDAKQIQDLYFGRQKHDDLTDVLRKSMKAQSNVDATTGLCLEVSTHARLLNQRELDMVTKKLNLQNRICCVFLSQFETEHAFRQELSKFFSQSPDEKLFLVQFNFDEPQSSKRLLACAKYCIVDERRKSQSPGLSHVVIITKVPRIQGGSGYLAFSGDEWTSLHLDELLPLEHFTAPLGQLSKMSVAEVFMKSAQQGLHADGSAKPGGTETGDSRCLEEKVQLLNIEYLIKQSVQKAVIQLEDKQDNRERATRRIQILYDALFSAQKKTAFAHSFMGELKKRICRLLQEREKRSLEPKEWTFHQAKSGKFILEGASFRHTLWIYIEDIMVNVFAQILAVIDANNNLDHISQEAPLSDLWLRMFQDESFLKIKYTSKVPDAKIAVLSMTEDPNTSVVCQFPFSWVLKADLDAIWETVHQAKGFPRDPTRDSAEMFQRLIQNVPMPDVDEVDVVQFYASDFVRMALPGQDLKVYEVLSNVLITGAKKLRSSVAGNDLRFSLIWLHIEYFYLRDTYQLFIDLVKTEESITDELQNMYSKDSTAMFVSLDALNILLRQLQPTEETFVSFATCLAWLKRVQSIKHTLNWVTSDDYQIRLYSEKGKLLSSILHRWNSTNIIYLLIDHLLHDETEMDEKLLRTVVKQSVFLWSLLYKTEDLKPEKIFEIVTKVLKTCSNHAVKVYFGKGVDKCRSCQQEITDPAQLPCAHIFCTQCILDWKHKQCRICKENIPKDYTPTVSQVTREAVENCNKFRRKCNSFFVEFVSSYCFGGRIPLPAKVIEQLIKFVACKPANSEHPESRCGKSNLSSPTHSTIRVYKPTSDLSPFEECMDPSPTVKSSLLKMLLQCRLDDVKIHLQAYLSRMEEVITSNQSIRDDFYFMVVRCFEDFMYSSSQEDASQEAEHCITSADLSTPSCAAVTDVHTLQLIARLRLAISHVATVLGTEFLSAAVPETRMNSEDAEKHRALLNAMKNMVENAQTPWPQIFLFRALLNIHGLNIMQKVLERERWILPRGCETSEFMDTRSNKTLMVSALGKAEDQLNSIKSEAAKNLTAATKQMESILEVPSLSEEPTEKLKKILSVIRSRDNCTCLEVVFHTAVVLSLSQQPITQVFRSICFQPSAVKDTYLPTMPGDLVSDVQNWKMTESEKMWKCQCGRLWCVENCGHPWVKEQCPCGHTVGGIFHKPVEGFAEVDTSEDRTERGYILGSPDSRSSEAERDLPAASVCLARVLLHSSMLLGTFTDRQSILNLMKKKPEVAKKFFQDHLEKDIAFLAESLGRNRDDATITVHLFLSYLLEVTAGKKMTAKSMHKKEDRIEWENCFKTLTQSFFQRLNEKLASAKQQIVEEAHSSGILKTADGQHLPFGDLPSTGLINQPCMWRFEQRMTIQHLTHVIQQESETSQFPVLLQILSKHHHIQYIQHLPDILSLQHALIHSYQNCDIHEEEQFSVREFLEQSHISGDQRLAFKGAVHIIQKVWSNIKLNPKSTGMQIPEELQNKEIDTDTAVLDLLPTDPSISSIVTKFLIELQNSLIDTAAQLTKEKQRSVSAEEVRVSSVITVTPSDMITMALSNFQYVLEENGTKTTQFNFQTLQRQAINRFISGKPSIKVQTAPSMPPRHLKTLQFTKAKVKEQLSQELLSVSQVKSVMEAARSVSDISRALSTLKVAAEFLAVTGGEPGRLLTDYVRNELRMDADAKHFRDLPVVPQTQLKHILSLWQVLSVRRSVLLVQMNQNPFFLVDKRYQEELEAVEREELTKALSTINIDFFIADLHEMIVVTLGSYSPKWGIVETFEGYLQQEGKEDQYIENLTRTLSQDLQMKHVISVWKTAVQTSKLYGSGYNRE